MSDAFSPRRRRGPEAAFARPGAASADRPSGAAKAGAGKSRPVRKRPLERHPSGRGGAFSGGSAFTPLWSQGVKPNFLYRSRSAPADAPTDNSAAPPSAVAPTAQPRLGTQRWSTAEALPRRASAERPLVTERRGRRDNSYAKRRTRHCCCGSDSRCLFGQGCRPTQETQRFVLRSKAGWHE